MDIGNAIKMCRIQRGLNQRELAELANLSKQAIAAYENGIRKPKYENLEAIADALNVSISTFVDRDEQKQALRAANNAPVLPTGVTPLAQLKHHYVPLIGSVAAGAPIFAEQNVECYVDGPRKADYALKVEGDSMIPTLQNGDTIFIRQQDVLENGEIGVVLIDDSACVKHVYTHDGGLLLISDNPSYPPRVVEAKECEYLKILGKVIGFTRMW